MSLIDALFGNWLEKQLKPIRMNINELNAKLAEQKAETESLRAQQAKVFTEVSTKLGENTTAIADLEKVVADLKAQIEAGTLPDSVTESVNALSDGLKGIREDLQKTDDLIPDVPTP
jgi:chromosome segregation ATPase